MDPLSVIFVPGGAVAALVLLSPVGIVLERLWRARGRRRNATHTCARCAVRFALSDDRFWFAGLLVCSSCATTLRRRLRIALPALAAVASTFALTSGTALAVSLARNGPSLGWWLDGRWIPLLLPSVGLGLAAASVIALGKRANRLAAGSWSTSLPSPCESSPVADRVPRSRVVR